MAVAYKEMKCSLLQAKWTGGSCLSTSKGQYFWTRALFTKQYSIGVCTGISGRGKRAKNCSRPAWPMVDHAWDESGKSQEKTGARPATWCTECVRLNLNIFFFVCLFGCLFLFYFLFVCQLVIENVCFCRETPMDLVTVEDLKRDGLLLRGQLVRRTKWDTIK